MPSYCFIYLIVNLVISEKQWRAQAGTEKNLLELKELHPRNHSPPSLILILL